MKLNDGYLLMNIYLQFQYTLNNFTHHVMYKQTLTLFLLVNVTSMSD